MIDRDKKLLLELKKFEMVPEIYTRFKDDIEVAVESLEKGSQIVDDKLVVSDTKKIVDEELTDTKVTMGVIQKNSKFYKSNDKAPDRHTLQP